MITLENHVGRLLELRVVGIATIEDLKQFRSTLGFLISRAGAELVACGDFREAAPLSEESGAMVLGVLRSDNRVMLRSAFLFKDGSEIATQMQQRVESARSPNRRNFMEQAPMIEFLREVSTREELARAEQFLAGVKPATR